MNFPLGIPRYARLSLVCASEKAWYMILCEGRSGIDAAVISTIFLLCVFLTRRLPHLMPESKVAQHEEAEGNFAILRTSLTSLLSTLTLHQRRRQDHSRSSSAISATIDIAQRTHRARSRALTNTQNFSNTKVLPLLPKHQHQSHNLHPPLPTHTPRRPSS